MTKQEARLEAEAVIERCPSAHALTDGEEVLNALCAWLARNGLVLTGDGFKRLRRGQRGPR